jgi:ATP-dependent RNA circularization protein (DNA/RNA ligase family)
VEELLQKLHLSETEREGVVLRKEDNADLSAVKWLAAAKLLTVKDFSEASMKNTMQSAWNLARDFTFRPIGKNLFLIQVFCLGDWKRIMEEGPWIF